MSDEKTTDVQRKSIYDSDDRPTPSDQKKAIDLYYQDGAPCPVKMAEELAMQRRYSVRHHRDIEKVDRKIDEQGKDLTDVHNVCMGNAKLGVESLPSQVSCHRAEQREFNADVNKKLNYILGGIAVVSVVVPIIIMLILTSKGES